MEDLMKIIYHNTPYIRDSDGNFSLHPKWKFKFITCNDVILPYNNGFQIEVYCFTHIPYGI